MNRHIPRVILGTLFLFGLPVSTADSESRQTTSLDGVWNFATDPDNRGETEQWFKPSAKLPAMPLPGYAPSANGTIQVPGVWDNQGYGVETDKVRHNFVGKGWYKRQAVIPASWTGRKIFLTITGAHRYTKVWLDEHFLGEHIGYLSVQQYDITPLVASGKNATITVQVDSKQRWEVDSMFGASTLNDYMEVAWGGIWGHVFLEARADVWLSDLYVRSDITKSTCNATATLGGNAALADVAKLEVFDQGGRRVAEGVAKINAPAAGRTVAVETAIPNAKLWTPDSPTLYTARLSLMKGADVLDAQQNRFGMRQFTVDGYRLLLNGKRIMLRGYGDDHIYPEHVSMPSDKDMFVRRLKTIKSYGFNHVRHHSAIMPPEYYDACDELGMITTAEFPIGYEPYVPGSGARWKQEVKPGTDPKAALDTYHREWTAIITQNRNHASILCWVMGNELYPDFPIRYSFRDIARRLDPSRMFLDSDGVDPALLGNPKLDRPTVAIYDIQFAEWSDPIMNTDKFKTAKPVKPVLSHEAGNYVAFSRLDLIDQFRHNIKPFWLTSGKAKLEKLGLLQEANLWAEKSERLYALLHKYNVETMRKNPYISGYHWWLFQDYWTTSNGIVDLYFRPKSITQEEVLKYNSEVVLLQDGLQRTYRGKSRLQLKLLASNFSAGPIEGTFAYEITAGEKTIAKKQIPLKAVPQGDLSTATTISLQLPNVTSPQPLRIAAKLASGERHFSNDWTSRLYPAEIAPQKSMPIFADATQQKRFAAWNLHPMPLDGDLPADAVYLTSWIDPRIVDAIHRGARVIVLDGVGSLLKAYPTTFRTSWWKAGEKREENKTGTFVYDHPATKAMAPDGWCDDGWFYLLEGGSKFDLEKSPCRPNVLVRALGSLMLPTDEALLFEVAINKGRLIVSGLNHRGAEGRPENQWLVARLIDHAATSPQPRVVWPASFLTATSIAPKGSIAGFRRLVANQGETGAWYSYLEDSAPIFVCRQTQPGNTVKWETSPLPNDSLAERATFVFAGALGYASEPKTEGFVLEINGKEILRFDLPEPKEWQSADKRVELRFESLRTVSADRMGVFHLTVPRGMLKPGRPCTLSVRSLGTGSRRWFGLTPYF